MRPSLLSIHHFTDTGGPFLVERGANMNMHEHFIKLFRYVAWANRRVIESLREQPATLPEALPLFAHLLAAEHIWLSRVRGRAATVPVWPELTLDQCASLADENAVAYADLVASADASALDRRIRYRNLAGVEYETPMAEILTHVATHGAYHRGQVAKAIGRAGGKSPNTDFITFVREK